MMFVRAEREGDWPLHLCAVQKTLPYFFAAGHFNYARYGLYYLRSMQRLHPDLLKRFMAGEHVMRHQDGLWNAIWSDLFIETTYMRYGHGQGGIIGNALNDSTTAIWALSHGVLTQMTNDLQDIKEGETQTVITVHKEERVPCMKDDMADRLKIRETLSTCIDVFDIDIHAGLVDIYSGRIVDDPNVNAHEALEISIASHQEYEDSWPTGFHNKIKKRVKTMEPTKHKIKLNDRDGTIGTEFIYARVLGIMASFLCNLFDVGKGTCSQIIKKHGCVSCPEN